MIGWPGLRANKHAALGERHMSSYCKMGLLPVLQSLVNSQLPLALASVSWCNVLTRLRFELV
jgi:hypothetical protein